MTKPSQSGPASELFRLTARDAVARVKKGEIRPRELVEASLARIAATEAAIHAMPTLCPERAFAAADKVSPAGLLAGLPIAIKDLDDVAGVRTTRGSPIYGAHVPARSDIMVERLESAGAIVVGKSNTPEFGAGANSYNQLFEATRTPWNTALTAGGSSGGSAAALAAGQVWLASGSDLGGSLRTPASFCGVVGLRPSPGRVASGPGALPFDTLAVTGPMARDVGDVALMLDAMTGRHDEDPLSLDAPPESFLGSALRPALPKRVAYSPDLGICRVTPAVRAVVDAAVARLGREGVAVETATPDLSEAPAIFKTLRAAGFVAGLRQEYEQHRHLLKPEVIWNIEHGRGLGAVDIAAAELGRGRLYHRMRAFMADFDLLLVPAAILPPFDVHTKWIRECEGEVFDNYVEWIRITYALTLTSLPVLCLPCGLTPQGLPIGLQLVGRPRGEAALLAAGAALEAIFGLSGRLPIDPRAAPSA
jgi:amidase